MTVITPFAIPLDVNVDTILERIAHSGRELGTIKLGYGAIRAGAIPIEIGNEAMFGDAKDIPVVELLDPSNKLHVLHAALLADLADTGCEYISLNPQWSGVNFSPHATMKSGEKLAKPFFCTTLALLGKTETDKRVISTVDLCD
jgi:hypothetical protein